MATHIVTRWEAQGSTDPLLTMMRAAASDPLAATHMGDFFWEQAVQPLIARVGGTDAAERASAVSVFIMGTVMQRYVLRTGPVAKASAPDLIDWMSDVIQTLLTGEELRPLPRPQSG